MKRFLAFLVFASLILTATAFAASSSLSVSVSSVAVNPGLVVRSTDQGTVTITANVSASGFVPASDTGIVVGTCKGNSHTGYTRTDTETVVTVLSQSVSATASDSNGNSGGMSISGGVATTSFADGPEGSTTVTVNASAAESYTTTTTSTSNSWPGTNGGCTGTETLGYPTSSASSSTTSLSGSASGNSSYLVDLIPPSVTSSKIGGNGSIDQASDINADMVISGGSAGTSFRVTLTALYSGDGTTSYTGTASGTFGNSKTGIANDKHAGPYGLPIPCGSPLGTYTLNGVVSTVDLANQPWPDIAVSFGPFNVLPAVNLSSETYLVAEFANPDGTTDYGFAPSFTASKKGRTGVATSPGSFHVAEIATTPGRCASVDNFSFAPGTTDLTLTIPAGFSYFSTSPLAHVFVGVLPQGTLFDYHNPALPEVTGSAVQTAPVLNADGSYTITVSLGNVAGNTATPTNGLFTGDTMIYVRAHNKFTGSGVPAPNSLFTFLGTDHIDNIDQSTPAVTKDNSSAYQTVANPQQ